MKIPRQTYFANFDTQAANRQLELCIRGGIGGRPPQSNSTRVALKNTFLLQIQSFHAALNSSNLAFISSLTVSPTTSNFLLSKEAFWHGLGIFILAWAFSIWHGPRPWPGYYRAVRCCEYPSGAWLWYTMKNSHNLCLMVCLIGPPSTVEVICHMCKFPN